MFFQNREKKKYYKWLIRKVDRGSWDMELRIITISEIREGIRREFDRISETIKAQGEMIKSLLGELKLGIDLVKELEKIKKEFPQDLDGHIKELQDQVIEATAKATTDMRRNFLMEKVEQLTHGNERKETEKKVNKIVNLIGMKQTLETDAENMQNQMIGKWSKKEQLYIGGIDQEIQSIKDKIEGGKAFRMLVKRELKKL